MAQKNNPGMEDRRLPEFHASGKFGAHYTKLRFHEVWDNLWRFSGHPDVVALTMVDLKGNMVEYSWQNDTPDNVDEPFNKVIQHINYKADYDHVTIGNFTESDVYGGELTPYAVFPTWNHWPVAQMLSDDRYASKDHPAINPVFVIKNWISNSPASLAVNGEGMISGPNIRQGIIRDTDGSRLLIVWFKMEVTEPVEIVFENSADGSNQGL
jgi:hypothetical protein